MGDLMGRVTVNRSGSSCGFRSVGYTFQVSLFVPRRVFARLLTYQLFQITMSMFSGLTNQISGWVANKTGQGEPGQEGVDPNMQQPMADGVNGGEYAQEGVEGGEQQAPPGGIGGFAQGLMMKAMTVKEGVKEKAGAINPGNLQAMGGQMVGGVMNMIPGRKEEEVPNPPEQMVEGGEVQYTEGGEQIQYTE